MLTAVATLAACGDGESESVDAATSSASRSATATTTTTVSAEPEDVAGRGNCASASLTGQPLDEARLNQLLAAVDEACASLR